MQLKRWLIGTFAMIPLLFLNSAQAQQSAPALQPVIQLSAKQAVDYALANQTAVRTAKLDELIQLAKNREVSGLALPTVSASGSYQDNPVIQKQLIDASNFSDTVPKGTLVPFAFGLKYNVVGEVKVTQVLFDPSVLVALQARKTLEDLAKKNVKKTEIDVKVSVYKAYYNVLSTRKALAFLEGNIASLDRTHYETKKTYENGLVEKLDVDRLSVQLTNLRTEETKLRNLLEVGTAALKFQMGMPIRQPIELTDTLSTNQIVADVAANENFDYSQRVEYQLLESQKHANEYDLKRYKLKALPSLSLFGTGGASRASNEFNYFRNEFWYGYVYYGINLNIPIFSGNQRRRQVDQALLNVKKTEVSMENLRQSIDFEQEQSLSNFRNNILTLEAQEKNMTLAQDVYNTTQVKYREGVGSSLEMTSAENDLLTAQNNYFTALYNAVVAKIDYLKAQGKL